MNDDGNEKKRTPQTEKSNRKEPVIEIRKGLEKERKKETRKGGNKGIRRFVLLHGNRLGIHARICSLCEDRAFHRTPTSVPQYPGAVKQNWQALEFASDTLRQGLASG